jgi:CubicO group peptidase (beta-lactamase class C family)
MFASDELDRLVGAAQAERRLPSLSAAVFHRGEVVWARAIGLADVEGREEASPQHAYRIGSITKTFTAVCVLQLRDAGLVELDAPLKTYVEEAPDGPTVRQALSHLSGIQREPPGDIWETLAPPSRQELLDRLREAERVLAPGEVWHYSNLAFALLGEIVARLGGGSYREYLQARVLDPLGLTRTTFTPSEPSSRGYFVDPYSDVAYPEPDLVMSESTAALGQLWSTTADLAAWGSFIADGREGVLARTTLDEMARVQTMADDASWTLGWGLGLELFRSGDRVLAGHGGAMPGFLAGLAVSRGHGVGAAVLTSASTRARAEELAVQLACTALDALPADEPRWLPGAEPPPEVRELLGPWWTEGNELVLSYVGGRFQAELVKGPAGRRVSWFEQETADHFRVVEGRERGEQLRVVRDDTGAVVKLYFATYPVTRTPQTFG